MATFDINDVARRAQYTSTGQAGPYAFNFQVNAASELQVYKNDDLQTDAVHYNATIASDGTGSITFIDNSGSGGSNFTPSSGDLITIIGDQPLSRTTVFQVGQANNPTTLETEFDNVVIRQQQLKEIMDRSIQLKPSTPRTVTGSGTSGPIYWPYDATPSNNASKIVAYNSAGTGLELGPTTTNINTLAAISSDISTVAGISSNVTTVAGIASDVTTAANNSSNITTVASNDANITTVAGQITPTNNISTVAGVASDITSVAAISSDVTAVASINAAHLSTVAGISSDVTTVAGISSNVTTVAGINTDVTSVAGISANVTTVAGISANVTTVAGVSANVTTVASDISNVNTVATNIANINTVAGSISDVITVANDLNEAVAEIDTVAGSITNVDAVGNDITNVNTVATNISNVNTVAGNSTNITTVANNNANVTTVANNDTNITTVAGQISPTNNIGTVAGISSDVSTVAGISSNVSTVASNNANVTTVAGSISNVNTVATDIANVNTVAGNNTNVSTVASDITNVNTVASNIADVNNFSDTYRISATAPTTSLDIGDLWFDTVNGVMKVYSASGWITAASAVNGTAERFKYTATASQTTFSGTDDNNNTLGYDAGFMDVFLNGIKLVSGASNDYVATNGTSIVLNSGAAANDILEAIAYGTFELLNSDVGDLGNVNTTGLATNDLLRYDGTNFVPKSFDEITPTQTSNAGKFLTTDGTNSSWATVAQYTLPTQTGNAGKFLTTDGTNESWGTVNTDLVSDLSPQLGADLDGNGNTIDLSGSTTELRLPRGTTAQQPTPSAANEGAIRYDTDDNVVYYSNGSNWFKINSTIPTLSSITGSIIAGAASNLTLTGTGFLTANLVVNFLQSSDSIDEDVTVTPTSPTSATVSVPAAVYNNVTSGNAVTIKVTNSDGIDSNTINKTAITLPTGGSISTSGNFRIHTFTSSGTFNNTISNLSVEYLVVAGGGGGGGDYGGGGGAGGYRTNVSGETSGRNSSAEGSLSLSTGNKTVTVGAGGAGGIYDNTRQGTVGQNSVFDSITSAGGGFGGGEGTGAGGNGGCGGGSDYNGNGGSGIAGQGFDGGDGIGGSPYSGGGGGGAGSAGGNATSSANGSAGNGLSSSITGSSVTRAGGGGVGYSSDFNFARTVGGSGGGGDGGVNQSSNGSNGTANTGGGGGGAGGSGTTTGGQGGSGIVIVRYDTTTI